MIEGDSGLVLSGPGSDWAHSVTTGADGSIYVAGVEDGIHARVMAFHPDGRTRWDNLYPPNAKPEALALVGDQVVVVGQGSSFDFGHGAHGALDGDAFVLALGAADGSYRWERIFSGADLDAARDVAAASGGGVIVVGHAAGGIDFGDGTRLPEESDGYLARLDVADGSLQWARFVGGAGTQSVTGLCIMEDGTQLVTGHFTGVLAVGTPPVDSGGEQWGYVAALESSGTARWVRPFSGRGAVSAGDLALTVDGLVVAVGAFTGRDTDFGGGPRAPSGSTIYVAAFDATTGAHQWDRTYGSFGVDRAHGIDASASSDLVVVGQHGGVIDFGGGSRTSVGNTTAFVLGLSSAGDYRWDTAIAGEGSASAVSIDAMGNPVVAGGFRDTLTIGDTTHRATMADGFVVTVLE